MSNLLFQDRTEAGQLLAGRVQYLANRPDVLVLAISRCSVPVAAEIARELRVPLDLFLVRPVPAPGNENVSMGTVAPGGLLVVNERVLRGLSISDEDLNKDSTTLAREMEEIEKTCRAGSPPVRTSGKIVIMVDDGRASRQTLRGAVIALRQQQPSGIILAMPVAALDLCAELENEVEQMICLETQEPGIAIGLYYRHFPEVTNEEVNELLRQSAEDLRQAERPLR
ncbi:MAG TPA: phosphoribosyltransferase family protein [Verrucomicrobiae bacterium]|nr:phosphoribosyltransferase family protein [Verrucomicrobiae bacterium]